MTETWGLSYLENLVGKTVTVFKGGPDSRTGVLSAIKDDYLVLTTDGNQAVYYPFSQLKSVIDNTKNSTFSLSNLYSSIEEVVYPETFLDTLRSLQLSHVLVNGGGPASSTGYIIDVKEEFIAIATGANGLVFYPLDEIKSLLVTNEESKEELPTIDFGGSHSFTELLRALLLKWTIINHGPNRVDGILVEVTDTYSVLVKNKEVIYVTNDLIQSVQQQVAVEEENNEEENSNSNSNSRARSNANIKRMLIENLMRTSSSRLQNITTSEE